MQSQAGDRRTQAEWFPDWLPASAAAPARNHTTTDYLLPEGRNSGNESYRLSDVSQGASSNGSKMNDVEAAEAAEQIPSALPEDELVIERNRDRAVKYVYDIRHVKLLALT